MSLSDWATLMQQHFKLLSRWIKKNNSYHPWIIHPQSPPPLLGVVTMKTSGGPSQIRLTSSVNTRLVRTQRTLGLHSAAGVCIKRDATDLSRVRLDLGEEGSLGEVHDVVLYILSLHYCAAVRSRQLTLFVPGAVHQLGVFILQPVVTGDRTGVSSTQINLIISSFRLWTGSILGHWLWFNLDFFLPARFLPEVAADANKQDCRTRPRGNAKLEPEIQRHTGVDLLGRQGHSSETLQGLLPHVGGFLKCNNRHQWSHISCFPIQLFMCSCLQVRHFKMTFEWSLILGMD